MEDHHGFGNNGFLTSEQDPVVPSDTTSAKNGIPQHAEIKVITTKNDFDRLHKKWNQLAQRSDTGIFQTFEWNRSWWTHFGAEHELHILAVYLDEKLIGLAPFFKDHINIFDRQLYACLRFIGSTVTQSKGSQLIGLQSYSDYLDFIVLPGFERIFYGMMVQHFNQNPDDVDEIILDEIPKKSTVWNSFTPALDEGAISYKTENDSITPVIELASTWDQYLKAMNSKERRKAKGYLKKSKEGKARKFDLKKIQDKEELPIASSNFIGMHQRQWNERGFAGTFSEDSMRNFTTEIIQRFYQKDWIKIIKAVPISATEKAMAYDVLLSYKDRVYLLHRSMETDTETRKKAPGFVLLYSHIHEAIQNGAKVFDFLRGGENYKLSLATKIQQNKKVVIKAGIRKKGVSGLLALNVMLHLKHIKLEWGQVKFTVKGKSYTAAIKQYTTFILDRIKHKFLHK